MPVPNPAADARRERLLSGLRGRDLDQALDDPQLRKDLEDEARSPEDTRLITPDALETAKAAHAHRLAQPAFALFGDPADAVIVPGFLGSELVAANGNLGLIWIDPGLVADTRELSSLKLDTYRDEQDDQDAQNVAIRPNGAIPLIYGALKLTLKAIGYNTQIFGFDWRKGVDESARLLAAMIRDRANRPPRPLHLIAHSQGTLVARRALQLLGADVARQLVSTVVLLGPATAGTFSAATAIAGNHSLLETFRRYRIVPPDDFPEVLQSMTGLYQLLPWRDKPVDGAMPDDPNALDPALRWVRDHGEEFRKAAYWKGRVDPARLEKMYGYGRNVDASFLNDRTTIILGDRDTVGGVKFVTENGQPKLVEDTDFTTKGDGTVPHVYAKIEGVSRVFKAAGTEHMMLPATTSVIAAVRNVLAGRPPRIDAMPLAATGSDAIPVLTAPAPESLFPPPPAAPALAARRAARAPSAATPPVAPAGPPQIADVSPPQNRRLRVFSFDPLFATELDSLGVELVTLQLPWDFADGDHLRPGPVGEYLEVVDYDGPANCFYPPVNLNHPHLLAQDGMPPSEGDPRFHQQMVYAVAMNTIYHFESALGRVALWAPNLKRDAAGNFIPGASAGSQFVRQLRIYPHAMRQANAFYDPDRKALLFGYFPVVGNTIGGNLPGGMVFTCLSYDVVAHETTHALLDGLHRYFVQPSNADVFAFHEAFADVVALMQHFSHPEVLREQIARTRGDLEKESMLGVIASQFGEAQGNRGALRQYLGKKVKKGDVEVWEPVRPDPSLINKVSEPHARGAILVAALFRAFRNIYENRVKDLRRIATGGTGIMPDGDLHPDLVGRLADEAAKSARHMLIMCIRALDYVPPVDITFGEYLRAMITADYDLVKDDDRRYRVAVVAAFRDWGIYPPEVRSLSVDSLLWHPPEMSGLRRISEFFKECWCNEWTRGYDRLKVFLNSNDWAKRFHDWIADHLTPEQARGLGLALGADAPKSILRRKRTKGPDAQPDRPVFEVHSFRPCRRIGPDGQQRTDFVIEIVQRRRAFFDPARQTAVDGGPVVYSDAKPVPDRDFSFRGGCSLLVDPETGDVRYSICKSIASDARLERERRFRQGAFVPGSYLSPEDGGNPFGFLHGNH